MASMNELQRVVNFMQRDTQQSLPVLPNNGNPQGVNNVSPASMQPAPMPQAVQGAQHYPWLQRSPSVDIIKQILEQPIQRSMFAQQPAVQQPPMPMQQPAAQPPVMPMPDMPNLPIMPMRMR